MVPRPDCVAVTAYRQAIYRNMLSKTGLTREKTVVVHWRAGLPWKWPSYESLHNKYGTYHAQCFPIPNLRSWLQGSQYCLRIDDGLGGYLAEIGLAKPFLVFSEWEEKLTMPADSTW